jgi:hypothetical protein
MRPFLDAGLQTHYMMLEQLALDFDKECTAKHVDLTLPNHTLLKESARELKRFKDAVRNVAPHSSSTDM